MKKLILWVISAIISISGVQDIGILSSGQIDTNYGSHTCYSSEWKVTKKTILHWIRRGVIILQLL